MMSSVEQSLHHGFNMMSYSAGVLVFVDNYDDDSSFDDGGLRKLNQRWFTLDPSTGKMEYRFQNATHHQEG